MLAGTSYIEVTVKGKALLTAAAVARVEGRFQRVETTAAGREFVPARVEWINPRVRFISAAAPLMKLM